MFRKAILNKADEQTNIDKYSQMYSTYDIKKQNILQESKKKIHINILLKGF